jgi:AcrR family transcriptional regulator
MVRKVKAPEERRREIISVARALFEKQSYENTTMRHIIDEIGIAKGTLYHYFKSKEALLEAVVLQTVDEYVARIQSVLDATPGSSLERLRVLIAAGNIDASDEDILENLHRPGNVGMHTQQLAVTITKVAPLYASVIQQGCEEGLFQTEHPRECAEFLLAGFQFLTDMGIYHWESEALMRRAKAVPALIEAQLHAPKGSFDFLLE